MKKEGSMRHPHPTPTSRFTVATITILVQISPFLVHFVHIFSHLKIRKMVEDDMRNSFIFFLKVFSTVNMHFNYGSTVAPK